MFGFRKLRKIGEGENVIVYLSKHKAHELVAMGIFKQDQSGLLRDKKGRYVIIVNRPFYAFSTPFPTCNTYPYLWGRLQEGYAGGSITYAKDTTLYTNWHVAEMTNTVCYNGNPNYAQASLVKEWVPELENCTVLAIKRLLNMIAKYLGLGRLFKNPSSQYDFAEMQTTAPLNVGWDMPPLVFFAGSCLEKMEPGCAGLAFPNPLVNPQLPKKPFKVKGYCTLWQFESEGTAIGPLTITVTYENGQCAKFNDAYAILFTGPNFIPGCSGSPIFIEQEQN